MELNSQQKLSNEQRLLLKLKQATAKIQELQAATKEPIAIIGMGCRFPGGASTPEKFWEILQNGVDTITEVPSDRWPISKYYDPDPTTPGKIYTRYGAFVEQIQEFDASFFGISPKEAIHLDPQHRLLLEVTWEALERSATNPQKLIETQTGVFIGISTNDYSQNIFNQGPEQIDAYSGIGNGHSIASGRISYILGLKGPCLAVDTACSSSLISTHLACSSLRNQECNLALAGGVHLSISPEITINYCQAKMLSVDGRCKTFDAAADGFVRGEGCGMIVLKRLSDALSDQDNILAVIRGSATNQDGNSSGLTVPNGSSQQALIRQALENGGVEPASVSYLEAHGTGTSLGDPIEVEAVGEVFGATHSQQKPLIIGSVKTNIGHLESAAGIAGLMKVVLQLQNQKIAPSLHFHQPNPYINWDQLPVQVSTNVQPWQVNNHSRIAGISSFSIGGSNGHVIIEEAPAELRIKNSEFRIQDITERPIHLLTLSGKTEKALEDLVSNYQNYLETNPELALADVCYTANTGRAQFNHRLGVIASDPTELIEKLLGWKTKSELVGVFSGKPNSESPKIAFLFTGQGSQYTNMGRQLYEQAPTFRQALEQCDQILQPYLETSILEIIHPKDEQKSSLVDQTAYTQPAVFALEYALFKLWDSWGIKPNVVMGHSVGEYVAACIAGVFSLEDGLKLIAMRGKLMQKLPSGGEMVSVMASESQVTETIKEYTSQVTIAAVNGPESIVISGESGAIAAICDIFKSMGIKTKKLQVSHAFHSPLMEPMLTEFEAVAKQLTYNEPKIPLISNVTGTEVGAEITMAEYWVGHVREPVRFATSMKTLEEQGYETFLEIGPKPILLGMGRQCVKEDVGEWLPSLRPGVDEWQQMLSSLGQLYVKGAKIDWSGFDSDYSRQKVALPTYPFQRERYWVETKENKQRQHQNTDNINQTPIVQLLTQGNTETLTQQLETTGKLSSEKLKVLPELLDILAQQHQEQLTAATIKNWFYEIQWQPLTQTSSNTNIQPTHWLILADTTGVAEKLAQKLQQQGHEYSLVARGQNYQKLTANSYQLNPHIPQEFEQLYQEIQQNAQTPITKLIHLWSIDAPLSKDLTVETLESSQIWGCGSVVHLLQTLLKKSSIPELWLVTRGSQSVLSNTENHITGLAASPMWGLGRVVSLEHPQLWGGLIDLDPQAPATDETEILWQLLANQQEEDHLALRGEKTYVARLVNKDTPEFSQGLSLSSDGSYLITGGLGALGLHTAQWLVEKGAKKIVLTGRRPPTEKVSESIKQLEETGCQVRVFLGDVSVEADIGRILEQIQTSMPTLKGIIHAAGVTGEIKLLQELELSQLEAVLRPKVVGGWLLHQLTQKLELDFFVNFSSIASVWGSKGQAHYAAANHFLDGLTYYRRSLGTPSYSINWGPWSGGGMATGEAMDWLNQTGVKPLESEKAIVALEKVLVSNSPQTVVADMNWRLFKELYELGGKRSLLSEIPLDLEATDGQRAEEQEKQKQKVKTELLAKLEAASNEKRQEILTEHIRGQVAQVLGFSSSQLPEVNVGFVEMGMDSLMTVELRNQLQKSLNCSLPTTLAFECPNIISLTDYIYSKVLGWQLQEKEAKTRIEALEYTTTEPIAVVGMACRFPGGANSPQKLWQLLSDGVDAITEIPPQRWNVDNYYDPNPETPGKMSTRSGGFLQEDIAKFDPLFFGISEREAITIDPQHRLLLEVSWEALENTGYIPRRLDNSVTGVFVGITNCEYQVITGQATETNIAPYAVTGLPLNAATGRLSYTLGLTGPSMAIDTACSSSLVAIHQACQSLRLQECQMALAGGVNLWLLPDALIATSQAQMSSPDGRCQTFDEEANGTAWGEGCGMLVLKRLSDAQASKDNILAVISGSAVNQDGPSSGFTVPNSSSQQQVIRQALKMAKVKPSQVSYVEAHGTATSLGDPIELRSLAEVFGEERSAQEPLIIGSIKTNIGHLASAAGISGVMKVILQIQHRQIVPHLHLKNPTGKFDWENSPLVVATQPTTWDRNEPSVAGVSSFGASGTNAHVIIEEAPAELRIQDITERPIHLLTLSAKTEKALEDLVNSYQSYLQTNPELALGDICYTASTGRAHFNYRLGVIASDPTELIEKLLGWKTDSELVEVFSGQPNSESPKIAFLFTGQGSQYINMGQQLYEQAPTFRQALEQCDQILQPYLETSILEIIYPKDEQKSSLVDQTAYTQPAVFALEYALFKLWDSWGIKPNVVMGHSVGEYVAACMAGVFSLEDGLKLIAMRGKLMQKLPSGGEMVSVMASETQVTEAIKEYTSQVTIAAVNGPESIVISGESGAIATICDVLKNLGIKTKKLQVSHAFHSPLMEPMLTEFEAVAKQITYNEPKIPLISNVTGTEVGAEITMAEYWVGHVRQPVKFATSMKTMEEQGYETFLEIGAKPILLGMGRQCVTEDVGEWLPSLRPGVDEWQQMLSSLGKLYVKGVKIDWSGFDSDYSRQKVALPTYPFQRERYWVETTENKQRQHQNTDNINQTQIVQLLTQGNTETLTQQLETTGKLSSEKLKLLPELLDILAQQHQEQLTAATIKNWFYEIQWQPLTQTNSNTNIQPTHWLILADTTGVAEKLAQKLQQQGHEYSLVARGENYQKLTANSYQLNPHTPQEFEQLYQEIQQNAQTPITKLIHLWSLDAPPSKDLTVETLESSQIWGCGSVVHLLQTLLKKSSIPELWLVTRGSQSVLSNTENHITGLAASPMWGLGRVVSLEHPQLWGGLIDLEPQAPATDETEMLWQLLANQQEEDHLALRGEKTYVARLVNKDTPEFSQGLSLSSDGTYLITGGLGALGLHTAQWLVEKGAKNIVLTGRRPPTEKVSESIKQLEETGCQVRVLLGDVSVEADIGRILEQIQTSMPTLKGIIHAAGVLDDGTIQQMNWERFAKVMSPKLIGTWHLHTLTQNLPLDFFVCFSSIASMLGSPGQGNYAAANAFMDALASYRCSQGLSGLAINWGAWASEGMAARLAVEHQNRIENSGINEIAPKEGMSALELLLQTHSKQQVGVFPVDWSVLAKKSSLENSSSLLLELLQQETTPKKTDTQILEKWKAAPTTERQEILRSYIQSLVATTMGIKSSKIPTDANFIELGMDSLMSIEVVNQLSRDLNLVIYPREFYERPTINSLTQYLSDELNNNNDYVASSSSPKSLEIFEKKSIPNSSPLASSSERLPGIIFILSSPRSGSTLLRVMLAGHSSLFSPPELHLLPFNTMKERQEQFNASYLDEGLQKAFMEIQNLDAKASQTLIKDLESQNLSIQQVYEMLQKSIAPRLLVDKSPTYAINRTILERAEAIFTNSKYIYLVRHPYSVIESFVRMRMHKLMGFGNENPYQVAEQVWVKSNQNIRDFLSGLEPERYHQIHYEELVKEPEKVLSPLWEFLNIDFEPELLQPYQGDRMIGGVHQTSLPIGDPNFLQHDTIDQKLADKWKTIELPYPLATETQNIANQLNYELPHPNKKQYSVTADTEQLTMKEKFIEFRGNQICVCSWGAPNAPVVLCIHGILEQGLGWQEVALPLAAKGYQVVAPDLFGHGRSSHLEMVTSYNSLTFIAQIDRVMQELPDQPLLLVGHSMGAMLASAIATVRPQKIKELILVELPLPTEESKKELVVNQLTTCLDYLNSTPQHSIFPDMATAASKLRQATPSLSEEFSQLLAQRTTVPLQGGVCWSWDAIIRTRSVLSFNNFLGGRTQYLEMLKSIQVPTTLVYGDSSKLNRSEDLQQQQITMTQAKRIFLPGGHNLHIDAAKALAAVILKSQ